MAALNISETEALRKAKAAIERVLRQGLDLSDDSLHGRLMRAELAEAKDAIHTVVTMKGHYFN